jgi:hypothetical protein
MSMASEESDSPMPERLDSDERGVRLKRQQAVRELFDSTEEMNTITGESVTSTTTSPRKMKVSSKMDKSEIYIDKTDLYDFVMPNMILRQPGKSPAHASTTSPSLYQLRYHQSHGHYLDNPLARLGGIGSPNEQRKLNTRPEPLPSVLGTPLRPSPGMASLSTGSGEDSLEDRSPVVVRYVGGRHGSIRSGPNRGGWEVKPDSEAGTDTIIPKSQGGNEFRAPRKVKASYKSVKLEDLDL